MSSAILSETTAAPPCRRCAHVHGVVVRSVFAAGTVEKPCPECGCDARGDAYGARPRVHPADACPTSFVDHVAGRCSCDDGARSTTNHDAPSPTAANFERACRVHGLYGECAACDSPSRDSRVGARDPVRGGRHMARPWTDILRRPRHLAHELVGLLRWAWAAGDSGDSHAGSAGGSGAAHPDTSAGRQWLRKLVGP